MSYTSVNSDDSGSTHQRTNQAIVSPIASDYDDQDRLLNTPSHSSTPGGDVIYSTTNSDDEDNNNSSGGSNNEDDVIQDVDIGDQQVPNIKRKKSIRKELKTNINDTFNKVKALSKDDLKLDTGKYIKSIIYGGMDGLVSIFVSVAVVASGNAPVSVLLVIAVAKLIAGAISMGMGDYLGTQADVDFARGERARESWEVEYYIEGEKKEMVEIYTEKGIPHNIATEVVDILATNPKGFVDIMMIEELGITPDAESEVAWKNGLVNFCSFLIFGIIPLLPYFIFLVVATAAHLNHDDNMPTFISVIAIAVVTLFGMGVFKAKSTDTIWWKNGISTVFFGCIGAFTGFITVIIIKWINPSINIDG